MSMFVLDEVDFTNNVNKRSYSVNQMNEIETWVDANHKTHGDLLRTKVSGEFQLTFITAESYNAFVNTAVNAKGDDGKFPVEVYVNNINDTVSINAFMTFETQTVFATSAFNGVPVVFQVNCSIEEE